MARLTHYTQQVTHQMLNDSFKQIVYFFIIITILTSCEPVNPSLDYLQTHPTRLITAWEKCVTESSFTHVETPYCRSIKKMKDQMVAFIEMEQSDPEKVGQRILTLETQCVDLKHRYQNEKVKLMTLIMTKNDALIEQQKIVTHQTYQQYQALREEIRMLLVVVGLHTPE